ncbi:MAG: outer membrane beta-barrel protein [Candidatus Brocadiae bacterium]|nr:outer membrane beta-barrel protein [Candidatus Brocadiia bacterium]
MVQSFLKIAFLCSLIFAVSLQAQNDYEMTDDSVYFASPSHAVVEEKTSFDIIPYQWSLRFGGGYALSLLDFDFEREGILEGITAQILDKEESTGFNFSMSVEAKFGLPKPLENLAVGLAISYNFTSVNELDMDIQGATLVKVSEDDLAKFHVVSFIAFIEYRYPFQVGKSWVSPYARAGVGVNANMNTRRDLLHVQDASFAMMFAVGVEYHVSSKMSLFFEPRFHYNRADFVFHPFDGGGKFRGTVDLSNIAFLLGVNFYFGTGESL